MDKLVEYVVGDGPNSRYALICRYCATHNGLATQEEFPYLGFRCAYCKQFNPPKQVRPAAPKLPTNTVLFEELESTIKTDKSESQIVTHAEDSETENKDKGSSPQQTPESDTGSDAETNTKAQEVTESENEVKVQSASEDDEREAEATHAEGLGAEITQVEGQAQDEVVESMEVDDINNEGPQPLLEEEANTNTPADNDYIQSADPIDETNPSVPLVQEH
jgi:hypothetical protein